MGDLCRDMRGVEKRDDPLKIARLSKDDGCCFRVPTAIVG